MPRYSREQTEAAVVVSLSYAETLRRLRMCPTGGGAEVLKKYVGLWDISTAHFDPSAAQRAGLGHTARPLAEVLVEGSSYHRQHLKRRLLAERLKEPTCELCGQGEEWRGRRMSLILDHINGVRDDNRLENLRIVCANCNATLDTHCGRSARVHPLERECEHCSRTFRPNYAAQRYCSRQCGTRWARSRRLSPRPETRKTERPSYEQLVAEVSAEGWRATARRYGVSDNAVKKWARQFEAELGIEDADALRPPSLSSRWADGRPPMRPSDKAR